MQKVVGIVGGGQLGRMLTLAALPLGFKVLVVDPNDNSPASQVGAEQIKADLYDKKALQKLSKLADYITVEIEHLDAATLEELASNGTLVNPAPKSIRLIQDKLKQKEYLHQIGLPVAPFVPINNSEDAEKALELFEGQMILKSRFGAYDGRGNAKVSSLQSLKSALSSFGETALYSEKIMPFTKELAVMVARDFKGRVVSYPVTETVHQRNICIETHSPAQVDKKTLLRTRKIAETAIKNLSGSGVFGVEMFLLSDGLIVINEIAPRTHNSGHYTMNACQTSQFEQHIRAITGLPLGRTDLLAPACVMVNILGERDGPTKLKGLDKALAIPGVSVHIYGKSPTKIDRKMGHINAIGSTIKQARDRAHKARKLIDI